MMAADEDMAPPLFGDDLPSFDTLPGPDTTGLSQISTRLSHSEQAAFNELAYEFGLDTKYRELALRVAERPPAEFQQSMALFMGSILQEVRSIKARTDQTVSQAPLESHDSWVPSTELNEHVRRYAATVLTHPDLESYTATEDEMKRPISGSFEAKVMDHLNQQSAAWKARLLPPRLGQANNPGPARLLIQYVKKTIKHNRDSFRKMILIHVLDEYKQPPKLPVPNLPDLITQIIIQCGCAGINNRDQVLANLTMDHKMRFALLRIAALYYYTHPTANKNNSQWTLIDTRLGSLRRHSNIYRQAFYALVLEQDQRLFGAGNTLFTDLQPEQFELPSNAAVESRAATLGTRLASQ